MDQYIADAERTLNMGKSQSLLNYPVLSTLIVDIVNQQSVQVSEIYEEKFDLSDYEDFAPSQPLGEDEPEFDEFDEFFEPEEDCRHLGGHEHKLSAFHVSPADLATIPRPTPSPDTILHFIPLDEDILSRSASPSTRILQSSLEEIFEYHTAIPRHSIFS